MADFNVDVTVSAHGVITVYDVDDEAEALQEAEDQGLELGDIAEILDILETRIHRG